MEGISKSLQSTPTSDDLFGMMVAAEIKNLSPKKRRKIKFEINNLLLKYQGDDDAAAVPQPPPIQTTTSDPEVWQCKHKSTQHFTEQTKAV